MYRSEYLDVQGQSMHTLVFEPEGAGPHPGLVIAQHLPVAHAGLEKDPLHHRRGGALRGDGVCLRHPVHLPLVA